jgi:hypothetical protein
VAYNFSIDMVIVKAANPIQVAAMEILISTA